jgi:hydrogenase nickel incorporation protein HypA/HybF
LPLAAKSKSLLPHLHLLLLLKLLKHPKLKSQCLLLRHLKLLHLLLLPLLSPRKTRRSTNSSPVGIESLRSNPQAFFMPVAKTNYCQVLDYTAMHEMSITQGIIDICLQHAGDKPVSVVVVEIGALSGVVSEAVEFCFSACSLDTVAEKARLEIRRIDGKGRCLNCNHAQPMQQLYDPCCRCGSYSLEVLSGEEMRVVEIEVAD